MGAGPSSCALWVPGVPVPTASPSLCPVPTSAQPTPPCGRSNGSSCSKCPRSRTAAALPALPPAQAGPSKESLPVTLHPHVLPLPTCLPPASCLSLPRAVRAPCPLSWTARVLATGARPPPLSFSPSEVTAILAEVRFDLSPAHPMYAQVHSRTALQTPCGRRACALTGTRCVSLHSFQWLLFSSSWAFFLRGAPQHDPFEAQPWAP